MCGSTWATLLVTVCLHVGVVVAGSAAADFAAQNVSSGEDGPVFTIPRGAWERTVGDIPWPATSSDPNRGIVLGGFGAGAFMYNISGSFGPWADEVGEYDHHYLEGASFHFYEKIDGQIQVRSLTTDTTAKPTWSILDPGSGTYYALHPKGWTRYTVFTHELENQFFSPIIPHNYRETSFPVAVWQFGVTNPTGDSTECAVMLTWPHPPFSGKSDSRLGYFNAIRSASGKTGMVLKANDPGNRVEAEGSEWCLATASAGGDHIVSYATWDVDGDGSDIWDQFSDDGELSKNVNPFASAGAVAVKIILGPGETKTASIVLSWDFPVVAFESAYDGGRSTQWWKRYCEYFDTLSDNSFDVAVEALDSADVWSGEIDTWITSYTSDARYPDWLLCAAFNELYYNQMGGSFWESGLRSGHPDEFMGLHPEDHKNFVMESQAYTLSGNISVGHYSSIVYAKFWPEMERDLLRSHADIVLYWDKCDPVTPHQTAPEIGAPRDFVGTDSCGIGDPFFAVDPHAYWRRALPCEPGNIHVQTETSSKFIQRCWRYYSLYEDPGFLDYVWPALKSTYEFMKLYDCEPEPRDSLPDAQGYDNTYDGWGMYGTDMYSGTFWIGALEAMDTMATIMNDPIQPEVQAWLEAARRNLDAQLWDNDALYYHLDTGSEYPEAVFADALGGQRYTEALGLSDVLERWKMDAHLQKVYDVLVAPNVLYGARLGRLPDGSTVPTGDRDTREYWVGTTYWVAAMMYHAGMKAEALATAYGAFHPVFENEELAYWFNTPEAWLDNGYAPRPNGFYGLAKGGEPRSAKAPGETPIPEEYLSIGKSPHQYQRPRAVWELMFEMSKDLPIVPTQLLPEDFAYLGDDTPVLHWSGTIAEGGTYTLQVSTAIDFSENLQTVTGLTDTTYVWPDSIALADGLYFWRVQAIAEEGQQSGYQDAPFSFTVDADLPCDCTYLGDCTQDEQITPLDVAYMVQFVYVAAVPPPPAIPDCPAVNGDWDCDDKINPLDVMMAVNFVYRGWETGPCDPCASGP